MTNIIVVYQFARHNHVFNRKHLVNNLFISKRHFRRSVFNNDYYASKVFLLLLIFI